MRLLLVEDDAMIANSICKGLQMSGFVVDWAKDGQEAELALDQEVYSLLLLDLGLPKKNGLEILKTQRMKKNSLPVLILTAQNSISDRILGLNLGADDYLVKPFDLDEMIARVRALMRRHSGRATSQLEHGSLKLNPATFEVTLNGHRVELSAKEFSVLHVLMERPGEILSRGMIEDKLYGWGDEIESNAIEVHLHHLRKKLGPGVIKTIRGVGYRLVEASDVHS